MSTMRKKLFCLTLLAFALAPHLSLAAEVSVTPLLLDYTLEQREIKSEHITVTNPSDRQVMRIYASVNEITVGSGGEIKSFVPPSMSDNSISITSWIEISRARIELQPGETKDIPVTIKINPKAESGSYHAFIGFGTGRNRDEAEKKVLNGTASGVLVKISLDEKRTDFLRLARFFISRFVTGSDNKAISYEITNPTDKPIVPSGEVIFYDSRGNEVGSTAVNPAAEPIAAGDTKRFEDSVPMPDGFGRHKAFLSVEYGENQLASLQDTTFFYVVPIKQLIIIFVSVLAVAILVTIVVSRRYSGDDDFDPHDGHQVAMFDRRGEVSEDVHHDVNLKAEKQ